MSTVTTYPTMPFPSILSMVHGTNFCSAKCNVIHHYDTTLTVYLHYKSTVWVKTEVHWVMCHIQVTSAHRLKWCFMWLHHQIVDHTFGNEAGVGTLNFGCRLAAKIRHISKWWKASGNTECISITDHNSHTVQSARALHGKNMNSVYSLSQKYLDIPCYFHHEFLSLHLESFRI